LLIVFIDKNANHIRILVI